MTARPHAKGASDPLRYVVRLHAGAFEATSVEGKEALSMPFRFELRFFHEDPELVDPDETVGSEAAIRIEREGAVVRRIPGIVTEVATTAAAADSVEIALTIEPALALLAHKSDARVFVDRSVPEIVSEVLRDGRVEHEMRLRESYAPRPYCVQFGETDLAFVSRLLEDEGIFYALRDGDGVLVLADHASAYEPMGGDGDDLPFRHESGLRRDEEAVHELELCASLAPSRVALRDYSADRPDLSLDASAAGPTPAGAEHYDYPGKYALPEEGDRKARLVAESMACAALGTRGRSDCARLAPGRTFVLVDAPAGAGGGRYAVTSVAHAFRREADAFATSFEALDAGAMYRPRRATPRPVLAGMLTGFVTGPEGEDVHTDEAGRVKVIFPWDRRSIRDDTCSTWIPVLQDNTGSSCGIPRVGWEVLVGFLEGDPDRPVVLGRVYNAADPFPEALPENKTRTALQSLTSPGRGGSNQIRFEDRAGAEQVYVQAQRDQTVVAANDKSETVNASSTETVEGNEAIAVANDQSIVVGTERTTGIEGADVLSVAATRSRDVGADEQVSVTGGRGLFVGSVHIRKTDGYDTVRVKNLRETVGAVCLEACLKQATTAVERAMALAVGGLLLEATTAGKTETAKMLRVETIGAGLASIGNGSVSISTDAARKTTCAALRLVSTGALDVVSGAGLSFGTATGEATASGSIAIKVGGTELTLSGSTISIKTSGDITFEATSATLGASAGVMNP